LRRETLEAKNAMTTVRNGSSRAPDIGRIFRFALTKIMPELRGRVRGAEAAAAISAALGAVGAPSGPQLTEASH
jgi:hypothetical protein